MKLGLVIGRVVFNRLVPSLEGGRFLIISPFDSQHYNSFPDLQWVLSKEPSPVVYDDLGGGIGDTVGYVEGREATMPFERPTPIDAITVLIVDRIDYKPES